MSLLRPGLSEPLTQVLAVALGLSGCLVVYLKNSGVLFTISPSPNFFFFPLTILLIFLRGSFCCGNVGYVCNRLGPRSVAHIKCIEVIICGLGKALISVPVTGLYLS